MISLQNAMDVLGNLIFQRLIRSLTSTNGPKDEETAAILFENVITINIELHIIFIRR